jgi:hypothetical protein
VPPSEEFELLQAVYTRAWATRESGRGEGMLLEGLDKLGVEGFEESSPGRDLIVGLWERGVPPAELKRELLGALPRLAGKALASYAKAASLIVGYLRQGKAGDAERSSGDLPEN